MDYQVSPVPDNEAERIAALSSAMCAYVPRQDRFDRITRMARRMRHVPITLISIMRCAMRKPLYHAKTCNRLVVLGIGVLGTSPEEFGRSP